LTAVPAEIGDPMLHWKRYSKCFTRALEAKYVNVVRCPTGLQYGMRKTRSDWGPGFSKSREVVTDSGHALCSLLTAGIPNVAITGASPMPLAEECAALRRHDLVVCHAEGDVSRFGEIGVSAQHPDPGDLAALITRLLGGIDESKQP